VKFDSREKGLIISDNHFLKLVADYSEKENLQAQIIYV
jgi:hypothetical protein